MMFPGGQPRHRGGLLLEVMLALAIFIGTALTILSAVAGASESLDASRLRQRATDLARSAIAKIEAGIETAETLNGPVPVWRDDDAESEEFDDELPPPSGWELSIVTTPFGAGELTMLEVTAVKRTEVSGKTVATATLRQLVRLTPAVRDQVGEVDEVSREAARGAAELERRERRRGTPVRRESGRDGSGPGGTP